MTYWIKIGDQEDTKTILINIRNDCEGTSIEGEVADMIYDYDPSGATLTQTLSFTNTVATSHNDAAYCGGYEYGL